MNTAQVKMFGSVVEKLTSEGYTDLETEHHNETVRFYGTKDNKESFLVTILENGEVFSPLEICTSVKMKKVQTRSEETGLNYFDTVAEALEAAKKNPSIWKISFTLGSEHLRLVKTEIPSRSNMLLSELGHSNNPEYQWVLENIEDNREIQKLIDDYHNHADEGRR